MKIIQWETNDYDGGYRTFEAINRTILLSKKRQRDQHKQNFKQKLKAIAERGKILCSLGLFMRGIFKTFKRWT